MMAVLGGIVHQYNHWIALLATLLCVTGIWVTSRLFDHAVETHDRQRSGWYFLIALAVGVVIWCTHFMGMLGFDVGAPVGFEPLLTLALLLIGMIGSASGFLLAGSRPIGWTVVFGGALMGLGIVALHFIGVSAFRVQPELVDGSNLTLEALRTLALSVGCMALIVVATGLVSYLIDGRSTAELVERLRIMALTDTLTGLPNRANFNDRLELEMELALQRKGQLALIGIDLNRFKNINHLRGHAAGDEVLRVLGLRMKGLVYENEGEFVAKTGGDEFSALYRIAPADTPSDFLTRLEDALFQPIKLDGSDVFLGGSLGIAIWPDDAHDKESLVNNADLAMYRAKIDPIRSVCFYEAGMDQKVRDRRAIAADLREALAGNQFSLHYQVRTAITDGRIRGYEALLRWNHPEIGGIPPTEFIPIAEENGLILEIGRWVLRTACHEAATWDQPYKVAVNMSAVQFIHADLPKLVMETLLESGLPPDRLELDLTGSTIFADRNRALHILRRIKAMGVSIALGNFGTGFSSLDTLRAFPFDRIKIDRSFFGSTQSSPQTIAIIRTVLALGKSFGIPVLAEGIETCDQLSMLNDEGCDEAQGFLLGRPTSLDQIASGRQLQARGMCGEGDETPSHKVASAERAA